jgi:hypothetical protein
MQILMPLAFSLSKASILALLFQLFAVNKKMRLATYVGFAAIVAAYGPNLILGPWYSAPHAGESWSSLVTTGRPRHLVKVGLEQAVLAVVIDIYIFVLPFPMISSLKLASRKRIQLCFVFGTASLYVCDPCLCYICTLGYTYKSANGNLFGDSGVIASVIGLVLRVPLLSTDDPNWVQGQVFICM